MTATAQREKTPGTKPGVSFVGRSRRHLPEGNFAAAIARDLGGCNDLSPTAHDEYVGMRAAPQRKARHDSHVEVARLLRRRCPALQKLHERAAYCE
jgi:hypothetical protein